MDLTSDSGAALLRVLSVVLKLVDADRRTNHRRLYPPTPTHPPTPFDLAWSYILNYLRYICSAIEVYIDDSTASILTSG
jgi:hypothetical protein